MLGGARQSAVTVARPKTFPWLFRMVPDLRLAKEIDDPVPNGKALLQGGVNLALVTRPSPAVTPLSHVGIETVDVGYTTTATFERSLRLIASILDTPDATRKAESLQTTAKDGSPLPPEPSGLHVHEIQAEKASICCS
ncbi:hypothetical protein [Komagataeibacter sp. FNDCR2]|uniref:hypothetical protein n=1 Tax=Komagataeibacter sp. FNDCR2 TaxID=2878682 RepID=UPI001E3A5466|nr:hypothetical protein [Komagataeibacter sp. FNDCR2]MCE2576766.1 hypothetical protein [Komagataeibacter sp. FNDCR2]